MSDGSNNVLLIAFELDIDAEKVIQGEPRAFDRHLVVLQMNDGSVSVQERRFDKTAFWVQIHNLPFSLLTVEAVVCLGETLGTVTKMKDFEEFVSKWASLSHCAEVEKFHGTRGVRDGQRFSMNAC